MKPAPPMHVVEDTAPITFAQTAEIAEETGITEIDKLPVSEEPKP